MKYSIFSFCVVFSILFLSCTHEDSSIPKLGHVTFSLEQKSRQGGRIAEIATPASILLTVKDAQGKTIYENKKLTLLSFGGGYISESLEFTSGDYDLTEFIILDGADHAIYATPLEGSDLASLVTDALPIHFTISKNTTTKVVPQV